jgi:CxxC motif-containing protein (DUF1111 family)
LADWTNLKASHPPAALAHGGQATNIETAFTALSTADQLAVLDFLNGI